jgi:hypothetical protein
MKNENFFKDFPIVSDSPETSLDCMHGDAKIFALHAPVMSPMTSRTSRTTDDCSYMAF